MAINNAQWQTLVYIGTYLYSISYFFHGQLYVAFSRAVSFEIVAVSTIAKHRQRIENDRLVTSKVVYHDGLSSFLYVNKFVD
jgi:hypothetical protein